MKNLLQKFRQLSEPTRHATFAGIAIVIMLAGIYAMFTSVLQRFQAQSTIRRELVKQVEAKRYTVKTVDETYTTVKIPYGGFERDDKFCHFTTKDGVEIYVPRERVLLVTVEKD